MASRATEDFASHFENDGKSLRVTEQGSDMTRAHFRKTALGQSGRAASGATKEEARRKIPPESPGSKDRAGSGRPKARSLDGTTKKLLGVGPGTFRGVDGGNV